MNIQQDEIYIGIDINENWTQVSFYRPGMEEPETVSTVAGEEKYRIKTVVQKETEEEDLFLPFLRKVLRLVPGVMELSQITGIAFHLEQLELETVKGLKRITGQLGIPGERVFIQDAKESFCHFVMNQKKELRVHEVIQFRCEVNRVSALILKQDHKIQPHRIEIAEYDLGELPVDSKARDDAFAKMVQDLLGGRIISAIYLIGDGFEGEWLKESTHILCRGHRAFQGKNLFTKGACYRAMLKKQGKAAGYVYFSNYKIKDTIYLKVCRAGQSSFYALADAGSSRYELSGKCEVLLEGEPFVDIWLQAPAKDTARIESLELVDIQKRPPRASRLRIEALPGSSNQVLIRITDLGFGSWFASTGKVWEYYIDE